MNVLFYASGAVAVIAAIMVVSRVSAMHALVNLILTFLAIACVFWSLGAPFAAVLQIVIYAGAIIVLFVFVVMILNSGAREERLERTWLAGAIWAVPLVLGAVLLVLFVIVLGGRQGGMEAVQIGPKAVGESLFTDYIIGVELASVLLLAGLVAALHFGGFLVRLEDDDE